MSRSDKALIFEETKVQVLTSVTNTQRQSQIWEGANVSCTFTEGVCLLPYSCTSGGVTFGNISQLDNHSLAQLPSGYSTSFSLA